MRGLLIAVKLIPIFIIIDVGVLMSPMDVPVQYGQFCDVQKIAGTGLTNISTSIEDYDLGIEYHSSMIGDGDIEFYQANEYSQNADKLLRKVNSLNKTNDSNLNLFENLKLTYSGSAPLVGKKELASEIGAVIKEDFIVNEIVKEQTAFISSTGNESKTKHVPYNPVHTVGLDTKNTFSGTWGTDSKWHKMLSKNIIAHEKFSGKFEAEKLIKFHENPEEDKKASLCSGIDC